MEHLINSLHSNDFTDAVVQRKLLIKATLGENIRNGRVLSSGTFYSEITSESNTY